MPTNPYEPPQEEGKSGKPVRRQCWFLIVGLAWTALIIVTSTYADKLRYFTAVPMFWAYASLIVCGNTVSLVCLWRGVSGWWHLLCSPIWFLLLTELLIVFVRVASVVAGR